MLTRLEIRRRIGNDPFKQAIEKAMCARDVVFWVNRWVWTYDPRENIKTIPFDLFPRQEEFLRWVKERDDNKENGLAEKSRDVGFTWLCASYAAHCWLFQPGDATGFGSRKEDAVDKLGEMDSILEKIRFLLRNLPKWMRPANFEFGEHDNFMKIVNPANGSIIAGECGDDIGRGGRKSRYFVDEAAFLAHPKAVDGSLSANTNVRIDISTANGPGNPFHSKRYSGAVPVFTFHWRDDPRKDDEWAAKKKAELNDPVVWAREFEIDYNASLEGICIPGVTVRAAVGLFESDEFKAFYPDYVPAGEIVGGMDVAEEGKNQNVLIAVQGAHVRAVTSWGKKNTTQSAWHARDEAVKMQIARINYDSIGVGAGIKGTWDTNAEDLPFKTHPINVGLPPSSTRWPDGRMSSEKFVNLKAELWWILRTRFERAYEFWLYLHGEEGGAVHLPEEMISIPNHPTLIAQLSLPLYQSNETGKIQMESKKDLAKRGVESPDHAEALALVYAPGKRKGQFA